MELKEGLIYIYSNRKSEEEIVNPFFLYSLLSDLCKESFLIKKEVKDYWNIISKINIYEILLTKGIQEGLDYLKQIYSSYKNEINLFDYKQFVRYTVESISPRYFAIKETNKKVMNKIYGFEIVNGELIKYFGKKKEIVIPKEVKIIKPFAFTDNKNIKKITICNNLELIHSHAFNDLPNLNEVVLQDVDRIDEMAFSGCCNTKIICKNNYCRGFRWHKNWNVYDSNFFIQKRCRTIFNKVA